MKIAILIPSLIFRGGGARQLLCLAQELQKHGDVVKVFCSRFDPTTCYPELTKGLTIVPTLPKTSNRLQKVLVETTYYYIWNRRILQMVREFDPDVLHPHENPANLLAMRLKGTIRKSIVWMCNDVWHLYGYLFQKSSILSRIYLWPLRVYEYFLRSRVDRVVVLDHRIKRLVEAWYGSGKAVVVRSGVDVDRYLGFQPNETEVSKLRHHLGIPKNWKVLLCFSIFYRHRRFEDVIEALQRVALDYPEVNLTIIGDPRHDVGYYEDIKRLVTSLGLENRTTIVARSIPDNELLTYLSLAHVFIFPNNFQTWGLSVIEMMLLGKPCVVSNGAGVHEVLRDGETALIYDPGNIDRLKECIIRLLDDQTLYHRLSREGREFVVSRFSWENFSQDMRTVLENVVHSKQT